MVAGVLEIERGREGERERGPLIVVAFELKSCQRERRNYLHVSMFVCV